MDNENTPLQGSDRQVAWADQIRSSVLRHIDGLIREPISPGDHPATIPILQRHYTELRDRLSTEPSAKWWIDHRDQTDLATLTRLVFGEERRTSNINELREVRRTPR